MASADPLQASGDASNDAVEPPDRRPPRPDGAAAAALDGDASAAEPLPYGPHGRPPPPIPDKKETSASGVAPETIGVVDGKASEGRTRTKGRTSSGSKPPGAQPVSAMSSLSSLSTSDPDIIVALKGDDGGPVTSPLSPMSPTSLFSGVSARSGSPPLQRLRILPHSHTAPGTDSTPTDTFVLPPARRRRSSLGEIIFTPGSQLAPLAPLPDPAPPRLKRTYSQLNPKERAAVDFLSSISLGVPSKAGIDWAALEERRAELQAAAGEDGESMTADEPDLTEIEDRGAGRRVRPAFSGRGSASSRSTRFRFREPEPVSFSAMGLATPATDVPSSAVTESAAGSLADALPASLRTRLAGSLPTSPAISRLRNEAAMLAAAQKSRLVGQGPDSKRGSVSSAGASGTVGRASTGSAGSGSSAPSVTSAVPTVTSQPPTPAPTTAEAERPRPTQPLAPSTVINIPPAPVQTPEQTSALARVSTAAKRAGFKGLWRTLSMLGSRSLPPQDLELGEQPPGKRRRSDPGEPAPDFPTAVEPPDDRTPFLRPAERDGEEDVLIVPGRGLRTPGKGLVAELTNGRPVWTVAPPGGPVAVSSVRRWTAREGQEVRKRRARAEGGGQEVQAGVGSVGRLGRRAADDVSVPPGTPRARVGAGPKVTVTPATQARPSSAAQFEDEVDGVPVVAVPTIQQQGLLGVVTTGGGQPVLIGSYLPGQMTAAGMEKGRIKAESFAAALRSTGMLGPADPARTPTVPYSRYNPFALDDPTLRTGKHRTVMALPSYLSSIIQFAPRRELKDEINEQFRSLHPDLDPTLTLSMIRSIKKKVVDVAMEEGLELSSAAMSFVYFEKLVAQRRVAKLNRRLVAAACFLLAVKINDSKENTDFTELFSRMEDELGVTEQMVKAAEFQVYAALDFALFVPEEEVLPHLERLMRDRGIKWEDYVAEERVEVGAKGKGDPWFFVGEPAA